MVYRPRFRSQFGWGTRYDDQNCTMAAGAMLLDRQTLGRIQTTPPTLRRLSGVGETPDGTSMTDLAYAVQRGYQIEIKNPGPFETFESFESKVRAGRGAVIAGDCSIVRGKSRCPAGLSRNHALYVNEVSEASGRFLVMDPADRDESEGVFWLDRAQLKRYAGNWAAPGMINAAYSRRTGDGPGGEPIDPDPFGTKVDETKDLISGIGIVGIVIVGGVLIIGTAIALFVIGSRTDSVMAEE